MIAENMLQQLGMSSDELLPLIEGIRSDGYKSLRSYYHGDKVKPTRTVGESFLHTFILLPTDFANGKLISELRLERYGFSIKSLRRGEIRGDNPDVTMRLQAGDKLVLEGGVDDFRKAENALRIGSKISKTPVT
jgi:CPA2 family monovalent cation:H+ antiporter-2